MIKLSGEATIGLFFEVLVGILDHLHVREPYIIWGLFAAGLFLIGDSIIRGEWAEKITDPKKRIARRTLYGAFALCALSDSAVGYSQDWPQESPGPMRRQRRNRQANRLMQTATKVTLLQPSSRYLKGNPQVFRKRE